MMCYNIYLLLYSQILTLFGFKSHMWLDWEILSLPYLPYSKNHKCNTMRIAYFDSFLGHFLSLF